MPTTEETTTKRPRGFGDGRFGSRSGEPAIFGDPHVAKLYAADCAMMFEARGAKYEARPYTGLAPTPKPIVLSGALAGSPVPAVPLGRPFTVDSLARALFDTSDELAAIAARNEKTVADIRDRAWERETELVAKSQETARRVFGEWKP